MIIAKKRIFWAGVLAAFVLTAAVNRDAWIGKVGECAQDAAAMRATVASLPAEDQVAFLAAVNAAIAAMPGSDDVKAARFLAANRAAVIGASSTNRLAVLAEVFATVPPEYLTDINENFASDLFSRNGDPTKTYSDAQYAEIAKSSMEAISARCATAENGDVRAAFAALMFIRASGGSPSDLAATLSATLPGSQSTARSEWFPAALGENGQTKSYDPMLGAAQAGEEANHQLALQLSGYQQSVSVLADLANIGTGKADPVTGIGYTPLGDIGIAGTLDDIDQGLLRVPRTAILTPTLPNGDPNPYYSEKRGGRNYTNPIIPGRYWGQN